MTNKIELKLCLITIFLSFTFGCVRPIHTSHAPYGQMVNLLKSPEKSLITDSHPGFSWIVNDDQKGARQSSYQIMVSSSKSGLDGSVPDIWNSGKVNSDSSINVSFKGVPLRSNTSYLWKVRTWDEKNDASAYSRPQLFSTGDLDYIPLWPGESRWVQVKEEKGEIVWGLENRHPINFHVIKPTEIVKNEESYFADFGRAAFATLQIKLKIDSSFFEDNKVAKINITLGEKRDGPKIDPNSEGGVVYFQTELPLTKGKDEYVLELPRYKPSYPHSQVIPEQISEVIPFQYCQLEIDNNLVQVEEIHQLALYYQFDDSASSFTSSNHVLNQVYDQCKYSVKANTFNGDYAASQRERMLYEADAYIHQLSHYAVDREYAIARYSHENLIFHATWPTEWILHSVLMAWADYLHSGNQRSIEKYYDELKAKLLLPLAREDGLISTRTGKVTKDILSDIHFSGTTIRDIVDWPHGTPEGEEWVGPNGMYPEGEIDGYEFTDFNTVVNAFHYRGLILMGKIADALGKHQDKTFFNTTAEKVYKSFNQNFFDATQDIYIDGVGTSHASLHANMFPLAFGLVPEKNKAKVMDYIKSKGMACGVYGANFLLEALFNEGEAQHAIDLMTSDSDRSWVNMMRMGATMTTEAWGFPYKKNIGWSHAWSASPVHIIPRKLMGIEPIEPGFGKMIIKPQFGNLKFASQKLPTIRGDVHMEFKVEGNDLNMKVRLPANTSAVFYLPTAAEKIDEISCNNQPVDEKMKGIRFVKFENNFAIFEMKAGEFEFSTPFSLKHNS